MTWIQHEVSGTLVGDGLWRLDRDVVFRHKGKQYTVKRGFTTDFASIPKFYQWRFNPDDNEVAAAAVIHDALYAGEMVDRKLADEIFLTAMQELGAGWWKRNVMHKAVRVGGGFTYSSHTVQSINEARKYIDIQ